MITGINHIQITIPIGMEKRAKHFYCDLLGLEEIDKPLDLKINGGFWLQIGEIQIHVGVENDVERYKTKAHIAYQVTDIDMWRKKLESYDITIIESKSIPDLKRFELRDPFGNRVEIVKTKG